MSEEDNNLPVVAEKPSLLEYLDSFLPFQLPRIPLLRTAANLDKAAGRLILAKSEQRAVRIEAVTAKIKHQTNVEGRVLEASGRVAEQALKRNEIPTDSALAYLEAETQIKFGNRTKILEHAADDLRLDPPVEDSTAEIDSDWLNTFARMADEKSSAELQSLFGKILAGEIRRPGAFSLRTLALVSTLTSDEANRIVDTFKFVLEGRNIIDVEDNSGPAFSDLTAMGELGIISGVGGIFTTTYSIEPNKPFLLAGSGFGLGLKNITDETIKIATGSLLLTEPGKQLYKIAKIPNTSVDYLKSAAREMTSGQTARLMTPQTLDGKLEVYLLEIPKGESIKELEKIFPITKP